MHQLAAARGRGEQLQHSRRKGGGTTPLRRYQELCLKKESVLSESPLLFCADLCKNKHQFISAGVIDTALRVCQQYLSVLEHCDIDVTIETPQDENWGAFLQDYYKVVQ